MARSLPPSASVAEPQAGAKLFAPAAERNRLALLDVVRAHAPQVGAALEIASGTGQHISTFAAGLPDLQWQPTDIAPARCASIDAHIAEAGLRNVAAARILDATQPGWAQVHGPKDLILLINLLHLISEPEVRVLISQTAQALAPNGLFILYGPFKRSGTLTSAGDSKFDAELRAADPSIGYKDDLDICQQLADAGLIKITTIDMPANNLAFLARKPG